MRRWVRRTRGDTPEAGGITAARDERFWYWPSPNRCVASVTSGSIPHRLSSAGIRPASEHARASVTNPRRFRACPFREKTTCRRRWLTALAPFGLLGIIDHQVDGGSRLKAQALAQLVGFLAQGGRGIPRTTRTKWLKRVRWYGASRSR